MRDFSRTAEPHGAREVLGTAIASSSSSSPRAIEPVAIVEDDGETAEYMAVHDRAGLVALAQLGSLEIHTWAPTRRRPISPIQQSLTPSAWRAVGGRAVHRRHAGARR